MLPTALPLPTLPPLPPAALPGTAGTLPPLPSLPSLPTLPSTAAPKPFVLPSFSTVKSSVSTLKPVTSVAPITFTIAYRSLEPPPIDDSWSIARIMAECPPEGWVAAFTEARTQVTGTAYSSGIESRLLEEERAARATGYMGPTFFPLKCDLFRAFHLTPMSNVRVVIVGQDPYHQTLNNGQPRATGLSFSVRPYDSIPVSLINIYKEIQSCIPGWVQPPHGDLTKWAQNGVLMLNMCLTTKPHVAGAHKKLWMGFIQVILKHLMHANPRTIFLLWGKDAQVIEQMLQGTKAVIFTAAHPSGLSAARGFFGCKHFHLVNQELISRGEAPIDWSL